MQQCSWPNFLKSDPTSEYFDLGQNKNFQSPTPTSFIHEYIYICAHNILIRYDLILQSFLKLILLHLVLKVSICSNFITGPDSNARY